MGVREDPTPGVNRRSLGINLARLVWVILALTYFGIYVAALPYGYRAFGTLCSASPCLPWQLTPAGFEGLRQLGVSPGLYAGSRLAGEIALITWPLLGAFIFLRRAGEWIGLLVSMVLIAVGLNGFSDSVTVLVAAMPNLRLLEAILSAIGITLLILLLFLFPDGRFQPHWGLYLAVPLAIAALADPFLATVVPPIRGYSGTLVQLATLLVGVPAGTLAQIQRYRRYSTLEQRQQTKWVLYGFVGVLLIILTWATTTQFFPLSPGLPTVYFNLLGLPVLFVLMQTLPITMTFSILRYRLFDIDVIIKRTLVYGALTVTVLVIYFAAVAALQAALRAFTGQGDQLAIVGSTLLIAALFNPLRTRIQTTINRRFFRGDYDAARTLQAFGRSVRDEVDLASMQRSLLTTVQDTMHPEYLSLWLKADRGRRRVEHR